MSDKVITTIVDSENRIKFQTAKAGYDSFTTAGYLFKNKTESNTHFQDVKYPADFSFSDIGCLTSITNMYLKGNDNMLRIRGRNGYRMVTKNDMAKQWGVTVRNVNRYFKKFIDNNIIKHVVISANGELIMDGYMLNPLYIQTARRLTTLTYNIFKEELIPILGQWVYSRFEEISGKAIDGRTARLIADDIVVNNKRLSDVFPVIDKNNPEDLCNE